MEKASIFFKTFLFHHNRRSINRHRHSKGCRTDWADKFSGTGRCHPHGDSHRLPVCSHTTVPRSVVSAGASGIPYSGDPAPPPCLHVTIAAIISRTAAAIAASAVSVIAVIVIALVIHKSILSTARFWFVWLDLSY